jgi:hypothetical protein
MSFFMGRGVLFLGRIFLSRGQRSCSVWMTRCQPGQADGEYIFGHA